MQRIKELGGELVIPLFYEMHIVLEPSSRLMRENISHHDEKRLLGEAWSSFWSEFIDSICHPDLKKIKRRFAWSDYVRDKDVFGRDIDGSDVHEAFILPLDFHVRSSL